MCHSTGQRAHYLAPPRAGKLVSFDTHLFVTPPKGMEIGFVPIVVRQEITAP
jgi:hypothetical protein